MTDERPDEERRLGDLRRRLADSPALREAIEQAVKDGTLPEDLVPARSVDELDRGGELESVLRVDALEAIVRRVGRPPLVLRNDAV
jgi:endonuclease G, mitochondrial